MTSTVGSWEAVRTGARGLEIVGVHAVVLHTSKVLFWCFDKQIVGLDPSKSDLWKEFFNNPGAGSFQIWDPQSAGDTPAAQDIGANLFCAGQCQMQDGIILIAGGQDGAGASEITGQLDMYLDELFSGNDNGALKDVYTFDPNSEQWTPLPLLADGRYYPTCLTLNDGTAFVAGGLSNLARWTASASNWGENDQFETVEPGLTAMGPTAQKKFMSADQYPVIQQLPGSRLLFVFVETKAFLFDLDAQSFVQGMEFAPPSTNPLGQNVGRLTYPMQTGHCLLPQKEGEPSRILVVGGSTFDNFDANAGYLVTPDFVKSAAALQSALIFEFDPKNPGNSSWRFTNGQPGIGRLLCDTVLLPDGKVLVVNGILQGSAAGHSGEATNFVELFDPSDETFTKMEASDASHPRGYHSTAVLLPNGKIAIAGNTDAYNPGEGSMADDDTSIQVFTPPYLTGEPSQQPQVTGVPAQVPYGSKLTFDSSKGAPPNAATLMRPCAVTHTVDMGQRAIILNVEGGAGTIDVTFPSDRTLAPPGFYMLFFVASDGTPSNASWIQLVDQNPIYPPVDLGTYSGSGYMFVEEIFDGDITIEKIDAGARVTLESRHGGITIKDKISDQGTYANLKAATGVKIANKIDQHAVVEINAGGDISIGQTIDQHSQARLITTNGNISIGQKVDNTSSAWLQTGNGNVTIGQKIDQHSHTNFSVGGDVDIGEKIDQHSLVEGQIAGKLHIGLKIDQHSEAVLTVGGDVQIDQKLDANSHTEITSTNGSITVSQGMSDHASAKLIAVNGRIQMDTIDGGCTLDWNAQSLDCPHQNGTVNHL